MKRSKVGFIGTGKMGLNIAERIIESGHEVYACDIKKENLKKIIKAGAYGCNSIEDMVAKLPKPRIIIICIPAGKMIDDVIMDLRLCLSKNDAVIDTGNSFYKDTQRRARELGKMGIKFLDAGISGGVEGARHGACIMVGGDKKKFLELEYLFKTMSRGNSYGYFGKSGAGHLIKGYHNLIEYGFLQSLAEGLNGLIRVSKEEGIKLNPVEICGIWNKGSIIESRLIRDTQKAFQKYGTLKDIDGSVYGQTFGEMKKIIKISKDAGVKTYSCEAAVKARLSSLNTPSFSGKIINAVRNIFGGHEDWKKQ